MANKGSKQKYFNVAMPREIHTWLKVKSAESEISMIEIILLALRLAKAQFDDPFDLYERVEALEQGTTEEQIRDHYGL